MTPDRERGQALVEFALIVPLLLILLVGIFDVGRAVFLSNTLNNAVREGSRYASVRSALAPTPATDALVEDYVRSFATGVNPPPEVVTTWSSTGNYRGGQVTVTAAADYTPTLSQAFIGDALRVTLRASSTVVIQ